MPVLGAWLFASGWMLWWGLAAAVPVLIHLWNRWRYDEVEWGAMRFLAAALRQHQRRVQIERWLLLALRVLMLVLLALALAEPVVTGPSLAPGANPRSPRSSTILVIDGSYSMRYSEGGKSRFEMACEVALEEVRQAAPGDKYSLVLMASPPQVVIAEPSADHEAVTRVIEQLEPTQGGADLAATLLVLEQLVSTTDANAADDSPWLVHWLTDLGRTTWDAGDSEQCRSWLNRLDERCHFSLTSTGEQFAANSAVTRISSPRRLHIVGEEAEWEVEVANFSPRDEPRKRIAFRVDEQQWLEKYVEVPALGRAVARFTQRFDMPGEHWLQVKIADDGVTLDDTRWLAVPVQEATRVLCIQGSPHAADYIALALAPEDAGSSTIRPEIASEQRLLDLDTAEYDAVFLCNVARLTNEETAALQRFVARGGGLVLILGDLVQAENYNEQLGANSVLRLLPAMVGETQRGPVRRFDPLEYRHPLTAPFRGHERAGLLTAPTWVYRRLSQIGEQAEVALSFDNGDPALVTESVGQGRVLLWATAAAPEIVDRQGETIVPWTALPSWPSFPPLVHEMLRYAVGGQAANRNVFIGQRAASRLPSAQLVGDSFLQSPDGIRQRLTAHASTFDWQSETLSESGMYRASYGEPEQSHELFAANVDATEGDLEALDRQALQEYFGEPPRSQYASSGQNSLPFFRWLLGSVFVLMAAEVFLAWSFGRSSR